jgi:hypothetical protein
VNPVDATGKSRGGCNAVLNSGGSGHALIRGSRLVGGIASRRFLLRSLLACLSFGPRLRFRLRSSGKISLLDACEGAADASGENDGMSLELGEGLISMLIGTGDEIPSEWRRALSRASDKSKLLHSRGIALPEISPSHLVYKPVSNGNGDKCF